MLLHSSLTLFVVGSIGISIIMGRLQKANAAFRRSQQSLEAANKQLSAHAQALARSNDELRRFAYSVAHDLSTPVRSIAALTDLLVQRNASKLDESSLECASLIRDKAVRIQALIKGLLDYAAAVDITCATVSTDAGLAAHRALRDLESVLATTGAQVSVDQLPAVAAAEAPLVQVFTNLISNAIKYRHYARIPQVHVSAATQGDEVVCCVRDNGIGVDMQYASRIFAMFQRLHTDTSDGNGIGLALCKAIVESRGGRIWVESQVGTGSSFYFTLPKAGAAGKPPNDSGAPVPTLAASA